MLNEFLKSNGKNLNFTHRLMGVVRLPAPKSELLILKERWADLCYSLSIVRVLPHLSLSLKGGSLVHVMLSKDGGYV